MFPDFSKSGLELFCSGCDNLQPDGTCKLDHERPGIEAFFDSAEAAKDIKYHEKGIIEVAPEIYEQLCARRDFHSLQYQYVLAGSCPRSLQDGITGRMTPDGFQAEAADFHEGRYIHPAQLRRYTVKSLLNDLTEEVRRESRI